MWPSSRRSFSTVYGMKFFNILTPQVPGKIAASFPIILSGDGSGLTNYHPARAFDLPRSGSTYFRGLSNSRQFGDIKISGALYCDWIFLEKYQESCISKCREAEEVSR